MKKRFVEESGMCFGPFSEQSFFHIERCEQYQKIQQNMPISEFIIYQETKGNLISLEAKTTAPNPASKNVENPKEVFQQYIHEIQKKFENSLDLYLNMALRKELPEKFLDLDYQNLEVVFILVIKEHQKSWIVNIKNALEMSIRSVVRTNNIWKCKVEVLNEEMARKHNLIV